MMSAKGPSHRFFHQAMDSTVATQAATKHLDRASLYGLRGVFSQERQKSDDY
jgi:hypothetical protein